MSTRNLAIMFTDIQGFTARTSVSTREGIDKLLDAHDRLLKPVFATFRGTIVKTIGDAFLVWFESPTDAVICGLTIQEVLRQRNEKVAEHERLHVRVAINAGDVELRKDEKTGMVDVFGEPVNLAARLEGITEANEVWFTEAVYLTMNRAEAPSTEIGERTFKGIPNPVRVYKVIYEPGSDSARALAARVKFEDGERVSISRDIPVLTELRGRPAQRRLGRGVILALAIVGILAIIGGGMNWSAHHPSQRRVLVRAKQLVREKDYAEALNVLGTVDASPAVFDLERIALSEELANRAARHEPARVTFAWMSDLLARRPRLSAVREKIPASETAAVAERLLKESHARGINEDDFWRPLRDQLDKYPDNREVHLAAAKTISASGEYSPDTPLWLYEKAFERGNKPDRDLFPILCAILKTGSPKEEARIDARKLLVSNFPKEGAEWAKQAIDSSVEPEELINARELLVDLKDPAAERMDVVAITNLLNGDQMPAAQKALVSEKDSARKAHAVTVLAKAVDNFSFPKSNRLEVIAAVNAVAGKTVAKP